LSANSLPKLANLTTTPSALNMNRGPALLHLLHLLDKNTHKYGVQQVHNSFYGQFSYPAQRLEAKEPNNNKIQ